MTRFKLDKVNLLSYDQSPQWSADPRLNDKSNKCIWERIHPLQGLIQKGDSGGPLIVFQEGKPCVLGIVCHEYINYSFCFRSTRFTPVRYYKKWIENLLTDSEAPAFHETVVPGPASSCGVVPPSVIDSCLKTDVGRLASSSS